MPANDPGGPGRRLFTSSRRELPTAIKVSEHLLPRASHGPKPSLALGPSSGSAGGVGGGSARPARGGQHGEPGTPPGAAIRFVTNTATRHHDELLQDLRQLGFALEPSELATAPLAARSWLEREQRCPLALVHPAIAPLFAASSGEPPDCVLLGDGRNLLSYANQ